MGLVMEGADVPLDRAPLLGPGSREAPGGKGLGAQVGIRGTWGWGMALGRPRPRCVRVPRAAIGGMLDWRGARPSSSTG